MPSSSSPPPTWSRSSSAGTSPRLTSESLRAWVKQEAIDRGEQEGLTTDEREELLKPRREVKTLRLEREILKRAAALFARESETR